MIRPLILFVIVFLSFSSFSFGQSRHMFSPTGIMGRKTIVADTIIRSTLDFNGKIVFKYLDSNYTDSLDIRRFFRAKYDAMLRDTLEQYVVVNLTNDTLSFKRDNCNLIAEECARAIDSFYRPISCYMSASCITNFKCFEPLILRPGEILVIKDVSLRQGAPGTQVFDCILRLLMTNKKKLVSSPYRKAVNIQSFYINSEYQMQMLRNKDNFLFGY